jgi:hypothetical protein
LLLVELSADLEQMGEGSEELGRSDVETFSLRRFPSNRILAIC